IRSPGCANAGVASNNSTTIDKHKSVIRRDIDVAPRVVENQPEAPAREPSLALRAGGFHFVSFKRSYSSFSSFSWDSNSKKRALDSSGPKLFDAFSRARMRLAACLTYLTSFFSTAYRYRLRHL